MKAWRVTTLAALGMAAASAGDAGAAGSRDEIEAACKANGYVAETACPCIADQAIKQLSEAQRIWLVASISRNEAESARLQGAMTVQEIVAVGTFMSQAPQQCTQ